MDIVSSYQEIEQWLMTTWKELLCIDEIDAQSDFFDLGADSLIVIKLLSRIEQTFGENILAVDTLFVESQLGQAAAAIHRALSNHGS